MKVIGTFGQKGGPGKSTMAMAVAAAAAESGAKTLVVDTDPGQGTVSLWSDIAGTNLPFDVVREDNTTLLKALRTQTVYDLVVLDTPGHLVEVDMHLACAQVCDFGIVVAEPAGASLQPTATLIERVMKPSGIPYKVLINRVPTTADGPPDEQWYRRQMHNHGFPVFTTSMKTYAPHRRGMATGQVVTQMGFTARKAKADTYALAEELRKEGAL